MPKGVEHIARAARIATVDDVFPSMMPKGVEHRRIAGSMASAASVLPSSDAERR